MTPALAEAAKQLVTAGPADGGGSHAVAIRAVEACELLAQHLSRLLGEIGVRTLFDRSVILASARFPWLASARPSPDSAVALSSLRTALEQQPPGLAIEAAALVLVTFVELLERLIGEGLVERLLHEVWPTVFRIQEGST